MESVTINGKEYVPRNSSGAIKIVILQRGHVAVGRFDRKGNDCKLTNASIIRRWGTTKGLGEIAECGPLPDTILDKCGDLEFDYLTVIATMSVVEEKWLKEV